MKHESRFNEEENSRLEESQRQNKPLEFDSAEELIRYDARQTALPPRLLERLRNSIAQSGLGRAQWWRRLFP